MGKKQFKINRDSKLKSNSTYLPIFHFCQKSSSIKIINSVVVGKKIKVQEFCSSQEFWIWFASSNDVCWRWLKSFKTKNGQSFLWKWLNLYTQAALQKTIKMLTHTHISWLLVSVYHFEKGKKWKKVTAIQAAKMLTFSFFLQWWCWWWWKKK